MSCLRFGPVLLLAAIAQPALASHTLCTFSGSQGAEYYELEFIGDEEAEPVIVFSATSIGGRRLTLERADTVLERFSRGERSVSLSFRGRGDASQPPSFRLVGANGSARLTIGEKAIEGSLDCES
ncbi:hypothetical protein [Tahibacter amnicola]|uniref:Membrane-bound lysozyme inhibitor of c-type lysozyme MliC n=1 Tax=Tahibacter amnicola TaxID=2976241 RepID=A0ABY6BAQ8_9GAMM|nr:hypothetical protein [Tahibacter amnicola]UXI66887.1 hypothetical protein N4264_19320 [Tahibacter amnicola]